MFCCIVFKHTSFFPKMTKCVMFASILQNLAAKRMEVLFHMLWQQKFSFDHKHKGRQLYPLYLIWGIGLLFGAMLANTISSSASLILRTILAQTPKPVTALFSLIFPFVACAASLWCNTIILYYPVTFGEGICRGFCSMLLYCAARQAAWLYRLLFLFSGSISSVCMWLLLFRHVNNFDTKLWGDCYLSLITICVAIVIDIHILSPFLADLTKYL